MSKNNKIVNFPEDRILRKPYLSNKKPKGYHQERIKKLIRELQYEIIKAYDCEEVNQEQELEYQQILPLKRKDGKSTKFLVAVFPTHFPF